MNINWNDPNFQGFGRSREPRQPRERKAVGTPLGRTLNDAVAAIAHWAEHNMDDVLAAQAAYDARGAAGEG